MYTIHLNGADPEKIAQLMGGTLIMVNESDDTAMVAGGDPNKLTAQCEHAAYDDYFEVCEDCGMEGQQIHDSECEAVGYEIDEEGHCSHCGILLVEAA